MLQAFVLMLATLISTHVIAELRINVVGDVMLGNRLLNVNKSNPDFFKDAIPFLTDGDLNFANLEGPIGGSHPKTCTTEHCHTFSQPLDAAAILKNAGVNIVSVANNHARDMGQSGMNNTSKYLTDAGIWYAGYLDKPYVLAKIKHLTIAMVAFSANTGLPDYRNNDMFKSLIVEAKKNSDFVIVSMHAGCEGRNWMLVLDRDEICFGENRGNVDERMKKAIEYGADLVIGHGPHVPRGLNMHNGKLILWSLGNFATARGISVTGMNGLAPLIKVTYDDKLNLNNIKIISFKQEYDKGPRLDSRKEVETLMLNNSNVFTQRVIYFTMPDTTE